MATIAYLTIESTTSGCLSTACNTALSMGNSYQSEHEDQITVLSYSHSMAYDDRAHHDPIEIVKKIDKSSPILAQACSDADKLECILSFYRPTEKGSTEVFYEIKLTGAMIRSITTHMPDIVEFNGDEMKETISIAYRDIQWRHLSANTSAYTTWLKPFKSLR